MTDRKLLQLLKTDPNSGMAQLIGQYSGFVFSIVRGIMCDSCDSSEIEDCVTDVFLRFHFGLNKFEPKASVKTYLGIVARNAALNCVRAKKASFSLDSEELYFEIPDPRDTEEEAARKELIERVFGEIAAMKRPDPEIMFRKYYLGQSSKAIAEALGLSVSNVDTRAHRAVKRLRAKLGDQEI